jgi:phosphatidylglycerophosphate synthase
VNKTPAVLVCDARTASLEIAGLTVIDRLVVSAHLAGCAPIFVVCESAPPLARAEALEIAVTHITDVTAFQQIREPMLWVERTVLVEVRDLVSVVVMNGQLLSAEGGLLPVRMTVAEPKTIIASRLAMLISDAASAAEGERKLWGSLTSNADGLIDCLFNRSVGRPLSKLLVRTSISPNQVSLVSILIGIAAAWFFARGDFLTGALIFQLCAIIDCVDGDLARALFKQSRLGKWLDLGGDQVVHFSVFAAIGIGVARTDPSVPALALGASAALGVLLSFAVIVRALRMSRPQRGPLLDKLLDATANRDFSVLLLMLALWGRMDVFLWMAGIGIHVFWIALLALQVGRPTPFISRESI